MHTYICLYKEIYLSLRGFLSGGFCPEGFVRGNFFPSPLLSEYIDYNRKLNITFNFRFHMYEKNLNSVMSHALGEPPHPLSQTVTLSQTPSNPLECDILYGRPFNSLSVGLHQQAHLNSFICPSQKQRKLISTISVGVVITVFMDISNLI